MKCKFSVVKKGREYRTVAMCCKGVSFNDSSVQCDGNDKEKAACPLWNNGQRKFKVD